MEAANTRLRIGALALLIAATLAGGDPCGLLPPSHVEVPCVRVHPCNSGLAMARIQNYSLDDGSGPAVQQTEASLCYDEEYLNIMYRARDDNVYSSFSHCNDTVWVDDAVSASAVPLHDHPQLLV